jgi:hypothetical protein
MLAIGNHAEVLAGPNVELLLVRACTVSSLHNVSLLYATRSSALRMVLIAFGNKQAEEAAGRISNISSFKNDVSASGRPQRAAIQHGCTSRRFSDTCVLLQAALSHNVHIQTLLNQLHGLHYHSMPHPRELWRTFARTAVKANSIKSWSHNGPAADVLRAQSDSHSSSISVWTAQHDTGGAERLSLTGMGCKTEPRLCYS